MIEWMRSNILVQAALKIIRPITGAWAERQVSAIIRDGVALTQNQITDAKRIGVTIPERVRLRVVDHIALCLNFYR